MKAATNHARPHCAGRQRRVGVEDRLRTGVFKAIATADVFYGGAI
jgi:hypothetical protein